MNFSLGLGGWLGQRLKFGGGANGGNQNKGNRPKAAGSGGRPKFAKRTDYPDWFFGNGKSNPCMNPYINAVVRQLVINSVGGSGIQVMPMPTNKQGKVNKRLQKQLQKLWDDNKDRLDAGGRHSWATFNELAAVQLFAGGEVFAIACEDERIKNPLNLGFMLKGYKSVPFDSKDGYLDGVKCDNFGIVSSYLFSNGDSDPKAVGAESVIHAANYRDVDDTRGCSEIAPACDLAVELDYYDKESSQLVAAAKRLVAFVISKDEQVFPDGTPMVHIKGKPEDVSIQTMSSNLANNFSKDHRKNLYRSMCAAVGTGYGGTSGEYDGSYSASRQEMIVAGQNDLARQNKVIDSLIRPIYERFVQHCIGMGLVKIGAGDTDFLNAQFVAPKREHIDPLKQAKAVALELATNQTTLTEVLANRGKSFDTYIIHLKNELEKLKEHGLQPNGVEALKWLELNADNDSEEEQETSFAA